MQDPSEIIFWDDFDSRTTRVTCAKCNAEITKFVEAALKAEIKRPWWKRITGQIGAGHHDLWSLLWQQVWTWRNRRYVLMKFAITAYPRTAVKDKAFRFPETKGLNRRMG